MEDDILFAQLVGVAKLFDINFSFALPVFVSPYSTGTYLVQDVTSSGTVRRFIYAEIEPTLFHHLSEARKRRRGDPAFIAFEISEGEFLVEERERLMPILRNLLQNEELRARPFTRSAIALFCGETEIATEADIQALASFPPGSISRSYYRINVLARDKIKEAFVRHAGSDATLPKFRLIETESGLNLELCTGASQREVEDMRASVADCADALAQFADCSERRWRCTVSVEPKPVNDGIWIPAEATQENSGPTAANILERQWSDALGQVEQEIIMSNPNELTHAPARFWTGDPSFDHEEEAKILIYKGFALPSEWHPFIHKLDFSITALDRLHLLASLPALRRLDLMGTPVDNLLPLEKLTTLQNLNLRGTQIRDLSPLAGLTSLQSLSLGDTLVGDLLPLEKLTALQHLDLMNIRIKDLSPLEKLTALQRLILRGTLVDDLSPLEKLTALQHLDLRKTRVEDIGPLKKLTALQHLDLMDTWVEDIGPLKKLTALKRIDLMDTRIKDLSPLEKLTALVSLDFGDTRVKDVSMLGDLTSLQNLNMKGTWVADVTALAGLTALVRLNLRETRVADVTALAGLTTLQRLNLSHTRVVDVSPLARLTALLALDLTGTDVTNLSSLSGIPNLIITR